VTQPVFDARQLEAFLKRVEQFKTPIVAGIWPLISLRNAEFLANEVPGWSVPDEVFATHAEGAGKRKGSRACRGCGDRARDVHEGEAAGAGSPGERAVRRVEVALQVFQ